MYMKSKQRSVVFTDFITKLPSQELVDDYEAKVRPYKRKIRASIKEMSKEDRDTQWFVQDFLDNFKNKIEISQKMGKPHVFSEEVKDIYRIPQGKARIITRELNRVVEGMDINKLKQEQKLV